MRRLELVVVFVVRAHVLSSSPARTTPQHTRHTSPHLSVCVDFIPRRHQPVPLTIRQTPPCIPTHCSPDIHTCTPTPPPFKHAHTWPPLNGSCRPDRRLSCQEQQRRRRCRSRALEAPAGRCAAGQGAQGRGHVCGRGCGAAGQTRGPVLLSTLVRGCSASVVHADAATVQHSTAQADLASHTGSSGSCSRRLALRRTGAVGRAPRGQHTHTRTTKPTAPRTTPHRCPRHACRCPPCRAFTPQLAGVYSKLRKDGVPLEVVFVSMDRSDAQFQVRVCVYRV